MPSPWKPIPSPTFSAPITVAILPSGARRKNQSRWSSSPTASEIGLEASRAARISSRTPSIWALPAAQNSTRSQCSTGARGRSAQKKSEACPQFGPKCSRRGSSSAP
ncbi:hypothetical protein AKG36_00520 [Trueperella bernardiae]|nr:hypothetical protein AKG36_00520 [Trueperella bernardiae]